MVNSICLTMKSPASENKPIRVLVVDDTGDNIAPLIRETLAKSECIAVLSCEDIKEEEPSMLETMMIYARGLTDWPRGWAKDFKRNDYLKAAKGQAKHQGRKNKQNMLHVKRATRQKHRRAR